jgi:hypothetical protein
MLLSTWPETGFGDWLAEEQRAGVICGGIGDMKCENIERQCKKGTNFGLIRVCEDCTSVCAVALLVTLAPGLVDKNAIATGRDVRKVDGGGGHGAAHERPREDQKSVSEELHADIVARCQCR